MRDTVIKGVRQVYDIARNNAEIAVDQYGSESGFDSYLDNTMDTLSEYNLLTSDSRDYAYNVFERTLRQLASEDQLEHEGWS